MMQSSDDEREIQINTERTKSCNCDIRKRLKRNFEDYCEQATVHGVKYVRKGRIYKRIAWLIICVSLLIFGATQIHQIVLKWRQSPVVFSLNSNYSDISEIHFPAVTICTQTLPNRVKFNYTDFMIRFIKNRGNLTLFDDEDLKLFDAISKVYAKQLTKYYDELREKTENLFYKTDVMFETLKKHTLSHFFKFVFCKGVVPEQKDWGCNYRFTKILLKEGLCYSFNMLPKEKIFRPGVYFPMDDEPNLVLPNDKNTVRNAKEQRFYAIGTNEYLAGNQTKPYSVKSQRDRLHVQTRFYDDFTDATCEQEPVVFIHNPYEIPWDYFNKGYEIDVKQFKRVILNVSPSISKTDEILRSAFTPDERGCYFPDERKLEYFIHYSQDNCEFECLINASYFTHYRCTPFWMPTTNLKNVCRMNSFFTDIDVDFLLYNKSCGCLPDCNAVEYYVKKLGTQIIYSDDLVLTKEEYERNDTENFIDIYKNSHRSLLFLSKNEDFKYQTPIDDAIQTANLTPEFDVWSFKTVEIEVHYEDSKFLAMRRHQSYTFADFISQIGGILGCFLGMSILSIFELCYFCTIRMFKKHEHDPDEEII